MEMIKIKKGFILREVSGSFVVVPVGAASKDFKGLITLNQTGAFLWKQLLEGRTKEDLIKDLLNEYDVSEEIADRDCTAFIAKLVNGGLVE